MTSTLSPNTQAILLLTAPLVIGRGSSADSLTASEYRRLAVHLRNSQREPGDLLGQDSEAVLRTCGSVVDIARVRRLLERGFLLSQAVERWSTRAIWVVSRADATYPKRLKARLKDDAPAILYGAGEVTLLEGGGLAVVGSRHVDDELIGYTKEIGRLGARAKRAVVSGGARGIDQAAMRGALDAGGTAVGVLADSLEKAAMSREYRDALRERRLALVSPYDPGAGFNVGHAMQRNKLIYALADVALVVSSDVDKGGTWTGAMEQLEKLRLVPVYVRSSGSRSPGLDALARNGAFQWPEPRDVHAFEAALRDAPRPVGHTQSALPLRPSRSASGPVQHGVATDAATFEPPSPADELLSSVKDILVRLLRTPMSDAEVSAALQIATTQASSWLERLVADGFLERELGRYKALKTTPGRTDRR